MDRVARTTVETDGLCQPEDWALFTTEKPAYQDKAKALCAECPVRAMCLEEYFYEAGVVVGGTTWRERQRMLAEKRVPVLSYERLVDSHTRGGIRALMLESNLDEATAVSVAGDLKQLGR